MGKQTFLLEALDKATTEEEARLCQSKLDSVSRVIEGQTRAMVTLLQCKNNIGDLDVLKDVSGNCKLTELINAMEASISALI